MIHPDQKCWQPTRFYEERFLLPTLLVKLLGIIMQSFLWGDNYYNYHNDWFVTRFIHSVFPLNDTPWPKVLATNTFLWREVFVDNTFGQASGDNYIVIFRRKYNYHNDWYATSFIHSVFPLNDTPWPKVFASYTSLCIEAFVANTFGQAYGDNYAVIFMRR